MLLPELHAPLFVGLVLIALFVIAALLEIGGAWLVWQGVATPTHLIALAFGLGCINALDVPGRVVTLAPLSLIGEGIRLLCVAAGRPELGTQIAGGLLVILFGIWTLPGPHQHWLMGH